MPRKCRGCGEAGHNRQTCPKRAAAAAPIRELAKPCENHGYGHARRDHSKWSCPDRGATDNRPINGTLPDHDAPYSELSRELGFEPGDNKLLGLEGGKRLPPGDTRTLDLTGDHATALDDVLLYRMPVVARIADRLKRMVRRDHPTDTMLVALVDVLNESVELGAIRSRTLYCVLTQTALKQRWVDDAPARGIRP